jgi:NAD(P)-dependent dehydrogenase (short-subunit alcohol dehydrogenase family)
MWDRVMKTNVFGPMRVAECFVDNVAQSDARKLINIGSTVGSIQGRKVPAFVYSSSKTALHKVTNLLAGVLKDRNIVVAGVCPGRAKTQLGGPGAMIEVDDSVRGMRAVIDGLTMDQAGWLLRYTGDVVPW